MKKFIHYTLVCILILNSCGPSEREKKEKIEFEKRMQNIRWENSQINKAPKMINKILKQNYVFKDGIDEVEFRRINNCEFEFIEKNTGVQIFHHRFNIFDVKKFGASTYFSIKANDKYFRIISEGSGRAKWKRNSEIIIFELSSKRASERIIKQLKILKKGC